MSNEKKCPHAASKTRFELNVIMVLLGVVGLYFLNIWVSVAYLVGFFVFFFMKRPNRGSVDADPDAFIIKAFVMRLAFIAFVLLKIVNGVDFVKGLHMLAVVGFRDNTGSCYGK